MVSFREMMALTRAVVDAGANVASVSRALASSLTLPDFGETTPGTAGGGAKGTETIVDEVRVYSEDLRRITTLKKVEALVLNIHVPLILPGVIFRGRRLIFDYRRMMLLIE